MDKPVAAVLACLGLVTALVGIGVSRSAVTRYGNETVKRASRSLNPARWVAVWNMPTHIADLQGTRRYLIGVTLFWYGMLALLGVLAYASGRDW